MRSADEVLGFWFEEHGQEDWFGADPTFDEKLREGFFDTHAALMRGEGWSWRVSARGRVAEIIVLDQFSRQLHRGSAQSFAGDLAALCLAQELVASKKDKDLPDNYRMFALMPYMHSESLAVHEEAVRLFTELGMEGVLDFEMRHKQVIEKFGRYPKRNAALGRNSTPQERAYIAESGDSMF